jgi:two-component system phosphate regulon response regulator PhoB
MKAVWSEGRLHAIIIDCSARNFDAVELWRQFKSEEAIDGIPIAALLSPDKADQFVRLIQAGVDDGFVRPLIPGMLLHFLSKAGPPVRGEVTGLLPRTAKILRQGDLEIDLEAHRATFKGRRLELTPTGFRLLCHLLQYPNCVHSREDLVDIIWEDREGVDSRAVDVHVSRLRKSLRMDPRQCPIKTIRSWGYIFEASTAT